MHINLLTAIKQPLSIAHQDLVQRAIERETTEQVVVAQALHDLLLTSAYYGNEKYNQLGSMRKEVAAQRRSRRWPFIPTPQSQSITDEEHLDEDPFELDEPGSAPSYTGLAGGILLFLVLRLWCTIIPTWNRRLNGQRFYRRRAPPRLGRVVWVTGGSESSFVEARSLSAAMDDARARLGETMGRELGWCTNHDCIEFQALTQV